jgi:large subunit ribosomal protein L25
MYRLAAAPRGEGNPRALRRQGFIPGVIYGRGGHRLIQVQQGELERLLGQITRSSRITLTLDGEEWETFIKEIQYHPLTDKVLHIDFYLPAAEQEIELEVPVLLRGDPQGRRFGGVLRRLRTEILVKGLPAQIPEKIELDVSGLGLKESIRVREITLEGVKILTPPEFPIAVVKVPRREVVQEVAAEAPAEAPAEGEEAPAEGEAEAEPEK